jgi:hypothetical protein
MFLPSAISRFRSKHVGNHIAFVMISPFTAIGAVEAGARLLPGTREL